MPFLIFCHLQKRTSWRVSVEEETFTVGCSQGATVTVTDMQLAAREIAIRKQGTDFHLVDLAGRERVFLNGVRVTEAKIRTGDRVRVGHTCMLFIDETHPSEARIEQLESTLDREIFAPERIKEALEVPVTGQRWPWRVIVAIALCGLALGVLLAIVVAQLMDK